MMQMKLADGRESLSQWDTGRFLTVPDGISQVHFANKIYGRTEDVDVIDGKAQIPDYMMQSTNDLLAFGFVGTPENGYTKISRTFKVEKRPKPADYVFTKHDQTTLQGIIDRIEVLEKESNAWEEKDPTVHNWAKQPQKPTYTAAEVGALPDTTKIPDALPNPFALNFKGAVSATYDGRTPVTVEIPSDAHINSLINAALGVIENGTY